MRPARTILLVGENDDTLSPLRYVLRNSSPEPDAVLVPCYRVTTANSAQDALDYLCEHEYDVMLCQHPSASIKNLLRCMKDTFAWVPVLILTEKPPPEGMRYADHILYKPRMRTLLAKIKDATHHKGPRKSSPAAMRCGHNRKKPVQSETSVERVEVAA